MTALICGSMAYDTVMVFAGRFREQILPDRIHMLNVSFLVPTLKRNFGGCAGNIAYNVKLLGGNGLPMATVGNDFGPYSRWLESCGIDRSRLRTLDDEYTAQAFITTDLDDNQITAFHPGAMNFSHENRVTREIGTRIAIIGPDGKEGMMQHARQAAEAGMQVLFDPGQGLPMFSGEELNGFIEHADYVAVNDYEGKMLAERTGQSLEKIAQRVTALIYTMGSKGSVILTKGERHEIPCVEAEKVIDPTGCGDAYRAGLLYGLAHGWDWPSTGKLGSLMGSIKIASRGAQNHAPSRDELQARFKRAFGYSPWKS